MSLHEYAVTEPGSFERAVSGMRAELRSPSARRAFRIDGLKGGARAFFVWRFLQTEPHTALVITADAKAAERFATDLRFFLDESDDDSPFHRRVHLLPGWDVVPFEDLSPPADVVAARIEGLYHLRQGRDAIVVAAVDALITCVPPPSEMAHRWRYVVEGEDLDRDELSEQLVDWGYRRVALVEDRGDFSIRGGIIDVFPPAHANPVRLQLDGDTIETMREFDPVNQRVVALQPQLLLLPVREFSIATTRRRDSLQRIADRIEELELSRQERDLMLGGLQSGLLFPGVEFCLPYFHETLGSVLDYLPDHATIWMDGAGAIDAALEKIWAQIDKRAAERAAEPHFFPPPESLFDTPRSFRDRLARHPIVELEPLEMLTRRDDASHFTVRSFGTSDLKIKHEQDRKEVTFGPVAERVGKWLREGERILCIASSAGQATRLARLLETHDVASVQIAPTVRIQKSPSAVGVPGKTAAGADDDADSTDAETDSRLDLLELIESKTWAVRVLQGQLSEGFRLPDERIVVFTEADVFGEMRRRAARRVSVSQLLKNLSELKHNDFVVHIDHGVGIYRGLKHLQVAGTEGDYLNLEYASGDRLYLPVDRISLVQKYTGSEGETPSVDKLGGASWDRVKKKTREAILAMAHELLAIYAAREVNERKPYSQPEAYYREFEASFPFEETPDQKQAIDDVVSDMGKPRPMDRLICGDVGYGKTEVAVRATFQAAIDGRQVAVLVPTTVLAQQHLNTFRNRFEGHAIRVEMLSRFLTPAEVKDVVKGLKAGTVDVVIGTHRLLQSDIEFKNLGLLVVDEEHRFGVRHKERIKDMRKLVDCLTLTATPIPRTLQMSLFGIRDLSVIETPPVDRLAIRTYVTRYDEDLIRDAIQRELDRSGQVFFVHNRVENIEIMARHLRQLVPQAKVAVAHGQMNEHELEKVMLAFIKRDCDVLLCTAIIESGLDIPRANTIIINRADHFGLAQLYQIRGRVGRSHERAYAYLMIPGEHLITKDAQKRLQVLQELDDLGGGFKLAAHDLEIRGAGNLLGKQQSGQIAAVGFELYTQMMEDAVRQLRGEKVNADVEPEIQLGFPAYIPDTYIADENQRLVFYRRVAGINSNQDLDDITAELLERYGPIPPLVDSFLRIMDLRRYLKDCLVVRAMNRNGTITLQFHPDSPVDVDTMIALASDKKLKGKFRLSRDFQLSFAPDSKDWDGIIEETKVVLTRIRSQKRIPAEKA